MNITHRLRVALFALFLAGTVFVPAHAAPSITSTAVDHIAIFPNDRPTHVNVNSDIQFVATAYDASNTVVGGVTFTWSVGDGIGKITEDGILRGERGGIGTVTATTGTVSATAGVVVKGVATPKKPVVKPTVLSATTDAANTNTATNENVNATNTNSETVAPIQSEESGERSCHPMTTRAWIGILLGYALLLVIYYILLGETRSSLWWIPSAVLTALLVALFVGTQCSAERIWIPITLIVLGGGLSTLYWQLLYPRTPLAKL